jgi:hypothetical protein
MVMELQEILMAINMGVNGKRVKFMVGGPILFRMEHNLSPNGKVTNATGRD